MRPAKLRSGDFAVVTAPSLSLATVQDDVRRVADARLKTLGLRVRHGTHALDIDAFQTSGIEARIEDLHSAFLDPEVKAVFAARGGWSANQLLRHIDWSIVQSHPKIFCGFSNITTLCNAIYVKTGMITYYGSNYASFGKDTCETYTLTYMRNA